MVNIFGTSHQAQAYCRRRRAGSQPSEAMNKESIMRDNEFTSAVTPSLSILVLRGAVNGGCKSENIVSVAAGGGSAKSTVAAVQAAGPWAFHESSTSPLR